MTIVGSYQEKRRLETQKSCLFRLQSPIRRKVINLKKIPGTAQMARG